MKGTGMRAVVSVVLLGILAGSLACSAPAPAPVATPRVTPKPAPMLPSKAASKTAAPGAPHLTADGRLAFVESRRLTFGATVYSRVTQVNVKEQDRVAKGQLLAKVDSAQLERTVKGAEIAVSMAQLAISVAEGDRKQAELRMKSAETSLQLAQDQVKSVQVDLEQASDAFRKITYPYTYSTFTFDVPQAIILISDAKRQMDDLQKAMQAGMTAEQSAQASRQLQDAMDKLTKGNQLLTRGQGVDVFQSGGLSTQDFWMLREAQLNVDKAQLATANAQTVVKQTALALDIATAALGNSQLAVDRSNKQLEAARNELDRAKYELEKTTLAAPFDGVIVKVLVKEGDFWSDASTAAMEIVDPTTMELDVSVDELDILNIKKTQKVAITVYAYPDARIDGMVTSISPLPSEGPDGETTYEVKILFSVPEGMTLMAGMSGVADIAM